MDCKIGVRTYLEEDLDKAEYNPEPRSVINLFIISFLDYYLVYF